MSPVLMPAGNPRIGTEVVFWPADDDRCPMPTCPAIVVGHRGATLLLKVIWPDGRIVERVAALHRQNWRGLKIAADLIAAEGGASVYDLAGLACWELPPEH